MPAPATDPHGALAWQWCRVSLTLLTAQLEGWSLRVLDGLDGTALSDPALVRALEAAGAELWRVVYLMPSGEEHSQLTGVAMATAISSATVASRAASLARLLGRLNQRRLGVVAPHLLRDARNLAVDLARDPHVGSWPVHAEVLAMLVHGGSDPAAAVAATRATLGI